MKKFPLLPRRSQTDKRNYGHVLAVAGSENMAGAAVLTVRAALLSGSGLVTLAAPKAVRPALLKLLPEALSLEPSRRAIQDYIIKRKISVLAIGPGLGTKPKTAQLVRELVKDALVPVVLDADGLNAFQGRAALLKKHKAPLILTPHAGEFKRLFGTEVPASEKHKWALAKKVSKSYDGVLVMKGHRSVVTDGRNVYVNKTGNPGMAKGGSGDVLTGMTAAFIAQGLAPFEAACWAVYCHGLAGDRAAKKKSVLSVLASDMIAELPGVYQSLN